MSLWPLVSVWLTLRSIEWPYSIRVLGTLELSYFCLMTVLWSAVAAAAALHIWNARDLMTVLWAAVSIVTKKLFYVMHLGTVVTYTPPGNPHEIDIGECYAVF